MPPTHTNSLSILVNPNFEYFFIIPENFFNGNEPSSTKPIDYRLLNLFLLYLYEEQLSSECTKKTSIANLAHRWPHIAMDIRKRSITSWAWTFKVTSGTIQRQHEHLSDNLNNAMSARTLNMTSW